MPGALRQLQPKFGRLFESNAGVEQAVGEIDGEVEDEEEGGVENDEADDHGVVATERTVYQEYAEAGDLEDVFDNERAGEQVGEKRA